MKKTFFVGLLAPFALTGGFDNYNYNYVIPYQTRHESTPTAVS